MTTRARAVWCLSLTPRGIIKKLYFFGENPKGEGGVSPNPKFLLTEKTQNFLDFFAKRGGGSHPIQKGFIRKNEIFGHILPKGGDFVGKKNFFYIKPPFFGKLCQKISVFLIKPFWIGWDPPPLVKKIWVFSDKDFLDWPRPPPPFDRK